jgi:predicted transposase YdaD
MLYLYRNRTLYDDWHGVLLFSSRSLEPSNTIHQSLLNGNQVDRLYLDELGNPNDQPIGISLNATDAGFRNSSASPSPADPPASSASPT